MQRKLMFIECLKSVKHSSNLLKSFCLRSNIKHETQCFIRYPNTLKWVKKKLGCASIFNPFHGVWKSDETLCLMFDILRRNLLVRIPSKIILFEK